MAKIKYILSGTTAQRPTVVTIGFEYYNTTLGQLEIWNGTSWVSPSPNATPTVKGLVNQATASPDIATQASGETPTKAEFDALFAELRDIKTKLRTAGTLAPNTP